MSESLVGVAIDLEPKSPVMKATAQRIPTVADKKTNALGPMRNSKA